MKNAKFLIFSIALVIVCSCSTYKIDNSMWYNLTPSEVQGVQGEVVNGLYFCDNGKVLMKTAVVKDTTIIAKPMLTGYGEYSCSGSLKKGIQIEVKTEKKMDSKAIDYKGVITKKGMILIAPDSTYYIYQRAVKNR